METLKDIDQQLTELLAKKNALLYATDIDTKGMTKTEITAAAMSLPPLPDSLMELLKECGFMTGSSVYGDPNTAMDEDWCVNIPPHVFRGYAIGTQKASYFATDQFQALYANRNGLLLNIICFSDFTLMDTWKKATNVLHSLVVNNMQISKACLTKWSRVRLFRALCDVFEPVKDLYNPLPFDEAIKYSRCKRCGREAINFTNKAAKDNYLATGECERHDV